MPCSNIFVGGFSMGGRMAIEVVTHAPADCAMGGLIVMSGGGMDELALPSETKAGTRALFTHGRGDSVVPRAKGLASARALAALGFRVEWIGFEGGHQIPPPVRATIAPFLRGEAVGSAVP